VARRLAAPRPAIRHREQKIPESVAKLLRLVIAPIDVD
jgi:hypothetical protein